MNLSDMTISQLEELLRDLHMQMKEIRKRKRIISTVLQHRTMQDDARRKLKAMSDPERAALAQVIQAKGIPPQSAVGTPGAS